jgi:hypothetical protein
MAVSRTSLPAEACVTVLSDGGSAAAVADPGQPSQAARPARPTQPTQIGRYAIEGILGAGGMAVVYLARDPVLERAVALKVLHVVDDEHGAARLVREGQALARVSHPNVIQVYEVGREADGRIYIAMERIVGATLAAWLERPRARREILQVFAAAARGLSAAHAAGLVHRDFKPENVMVGDDGRVCVLDFGLARELDDCADSGEPGPRRARSPGATGYGGAVGTPAYMSPEQWRGERAGAASDQFSFCVALWRALTGEHPFDIRSRAALRAAVLAGEAARPPRSLPRRLRAVLRRGIAVDPAARCSSIDAIAAALAPPPRWRWLAAAAALAAPLAIAAQLTIATASDVAPRTNTTLYTPPTAITSRGDVGLAAVSPDGTRIALLTRDAAIVQALQPGADQRVLVRGRLGYQALSWSPGGSQLAFFGDVAGSTERPGLMLVELASGAVRRLGDNLGAVALLGNDELVAARFDSTHLAFYSLDDTTRPLRTCPLPGRFSGIRAVVFDAPSDAVYVQVDDGDRRSSVLRVDRRCRRIEVAADRLPILSFVVRPGDRRLLVHLMGDHQLVEIGDDGRSHLGQHVVQSKQYMPLAIRRDGQIVHCDHSARWALRAIAGDGRHRELAAGATHSRFSIAPDGRIAQVEGLYDGGLLRIGRLDTLDGGMATIAERVVRAVWSPDGERLAVLSQTADGYELAMWNASTRAMSVARPLAVPYDVELTWLDDRRVAYPVLHERTTFRWIDPASGATGTLAPGVGAMMTSLVRAHRDRRLAFLTEAPHAVTVWALVEGTPPRAIATVPVDAPRSSRTLRVTWAADDRSLVLYDVQSGDMWSITVATGAIARMAGGDSLGGGLTHLDAVFVLADRMVTATVSASSDINISAPITE